jgi:four helix bundle protein
MNDFRDLIFYRKAFENAMRIFKLTKCFPVEEKYGLASQIRNSSRSVCANIAEGYRKRQYDKHFVSKLSDADMENSETIVWLDFALACNYIDHKIHQTIVVNCEEIGRILNHAIRNPAKFM